MMPGGDPDSWKHLKPIWEAVAAKVDAKTGKPIENYAPGKPVTGGVPCTAYIGPNGAGHYVKMIHNGIEYIDMQLICEAYTLMQNLLGMKAPELAKVFSQWNEGDLDSYLIQITADILQQRDPVQKDGFLVDYVLDTAGQKGTGKWTSVNALDMGIPANAIAEAVFARCLSALKDERVAASKQPQRSRQHATHNRQQTRPHRRDPRRALLLEDLRLRPGLPAHARGAEGIQLEAELRRDRQRSGAAGASSAPASSRRSPTPTRATPIW